MTVFKINIKTYLLQLLPLKIIRKYKTITFKQILLIKNIYFKYFKMINYKK